jgi:hypothetical protein
MTEYKPKPGHRVFVYTTPGVVRKLIGDNFSEVRSDWLTAFNNPLDITANNAQLTYVPSHAADDRHPAVDEYGEKWGNPDSEEVKDYMDSYVPKHRRGDE